MVSLMKKGTLKPIRWQKKDYNSINVLFTIMNKNTNTREQVSTPTNVITPKPSTSNSSSTSNVGSNGREVPAPTTVLKR